MSQSKSVLVVDDRGSGKPLPNELRAALAGAIVGGLLTGVVTFFGVMLSDHYSEKQRIRENQHDDQQRAIDRRSAEYSIILRDHGDATQVRSRGPDYNYELNGHIAILQALGDDKGAAALYEFYKKSDLWVGKKISQEDFFKARGDFVAVIRPGLQFAPEK